MNVLLLGGPADGQTSTVLADKMPKTVIVPGLGSKSEWYGTEQPIPREYLSMLFKHHYDQTEQTQDGMPVYRFARSVSETVTLPALWTLG